MTIKGSCLCGSVTFEIEKTVGPFEICHCSRCRKVSGSQGIAAVGVRTQDFRMLAGEDLIKGFTAPLLDAPPAYQVFSVLAVAHPSPIRHRRVTGLKFRPDYLMSRCKCSLISIYMLNSSLTGIPSPTSFLGTIRSNLASTEEVST